MGDHAENELSCVQELAERRVVIPLFCRRMETSLSPEIDTTEGPCRRWCTDTSLVSFWGEKSCSAFNKCGFLLLLWKWVLTEVSERILQHIKLFHYLVTPYNGIIIPSFAWRWKIRLWTPTAGFVFVLCKWLLTVRLTSETKHPTPSDFKEAFFFFALCLCGFSNICVDFRGMLSLCITRFTLHNDLFVVYMDSAKTLQLILLRCIFEVDRNKLFNFWIWYKRVTWIPQIIFVEKAPLDIFKAGSKWAVTVT